MATCAHGPPPSKKLQTIPTDTVPNRVLHLHIYADMASEAIIASMSYLPLYI